MSLIYRIPDSDDAAYDIFLAAPSAMPAETAIDLIDSAVRKVQDENPDEFTEDELMATLHPHGFRRVDVVVTNDRF